MNNLWRRFSLAVAFAALTMVGWVTPICAAEEDRGGPGDRLDRLERRVNEMAQRQEQLMQRLEMAREHLGPMAGPGREGFRPPMAGPGRRGMGEPTPPMGGPPAMGVPEAGLPPAGPAQVHKTLHDLLGLFFLVALIFNILAAVWIFSDIRKRGEGSGIFVALALIAGVPAAIIYAIARSGDKKTSSGFRRGPGGWKPPALSGRMPDTTIRHPGDAGLTGVT